MIRRLRLCLLFSILLLVNTSLLAEVYLNEVLFDAPVGSDNGQEYFEIVSTDPNYSLEGLRLVVLDGDHDGSGSAGEIDDVISLNGLSTGANRMLLAREGGTPSIPLIGFTPQPHESTAVDIAGNTSFNFQNADAISLLLVSGFSGRNGDDLDTNNDGLLDITPWETVLDAIAILDPTDPSYDYATQAGGRSFPILPYTPDLILRDSGSMEWIAADVIVADVEDEMPVGGFYAFNPEEITSISGDSIMLAGGWSPGIENPRVEATAVRYGDFNNDGVVNAADYSVWRDNLGGPESAIHDNGDGLNGVDAKDYLLWKQHFGSPEAELSTEQVPEPNAMLLAVGSLLLTGFARASVPLA